MLPGYSSLSIPAFRRLFIGQAISQFGDGLYYLVILFMADKASGGSAVALAVVGFAQAIPFLLFSPMAGRVADRVDRRLVMFWSDMLSALVTLGLFAAALIWPLPPVWVLALTGFLLSSVNAFFMPARTAAIPNLVPPDRLMEANALAVSSQQVVFMAAQAVSVAVTGLIFSTFPAVALPIVAIANAATFAASAFYIATLPPLQPSLEGREDHNMLKEILEGYRVIQRDPFIPTALWVSAVAHFFVAGWMILYVRSNSMWFGGQFHTLAFIEFSFFAVLAVTSLWVGKMKVRHIGWAFGLSWVGTGLLCAPMAWATNYWAFWALNALCGVTVAFAWLPVATYLQAAFADEVRGRASSTWNMVQQGIQPFGVAVTGPLVAVLGLQGMFLLMGIGISIAAAIGLLVPKFRRSQMPESALGTGT